MCQPKPGPRCSAHTREKMESAKQTLQHAIAFESDDIKKRALHDYLVAKEEHYTTKTGNKELRALAQTSLNSSDPATKRNGQAMLEQADRLAAKREKQVKAYKEKQQMEAEVAKHQKAASDARQRAQDSFERSDTDGFLTQHSSDLTARLHERKAEIAANGGKAEFPALFDLDGNMVPAKLVNTRYGPAWGLLSDPDNLSSEFTGFVNPSLAKDENRAKANLEKKGYRVGKVSAPAGADLAAPAGATGTSGMASVYVKTFRTDGGYSSDVEVLDTGK